MTSAEFVDCRSLAPGALIDVETKNRRYHIECLGGSVIRISGHPDFCPTATNGELQGSSDKTGSVEPGLIERGRYLKFIVAERLPVTTSRVVRVRVQQPSTNPRNWSSSIH
jgi:hypothetical protein